jgi:hypothetical protein
VHRQRLSKAQIERLLQEQERERQLREGWDLLKRPVKRTRKPGSGRNSKFTAQQRTRLQEKYSRDLKADPLLEKREAAVAHMQKLEKTVSAAPSTWLKHIIRPVLLARRK